LGVRKRCGDREIVDEMGLRAKERNIQTKIADVSKKFRLYQDVTKPNSFTRTASLRRILKDFRFT